MNSTTYRIDKLPAAAGSKSQEPTRYAVPCGMNSIMHLGAKEASSATKAGMRDSLQPGFVLVLSSWKGLNGASLTGEYVPYRVLSATRHSN